MTNQTPPAVPAPLLPDDVLDAITAAIAPALRELTAEMARRHGSLGAPVDASLGDDEVVDGASAVDLLNALYGAGLLSLDQQADLQRLRRNWAAVSGCLVMLGRHERPSVDLLQEVPAAHRAYLQGHAVIYDHLSELWGRILMARAGLHTLVGEGSVDDVLQIRRGDLGQVLHTLQGESTEPARTVPATPVDTVPNGGGLRLIHGQTLRP